MRQRRTVDPRTKGERREAEQRAKAEAIAKLRQVGLDPEHWSPRHLGKLASTHNRSCSCCLCKPGENRRAKILARLWCQEELSYS